MASVDCVCVRFLNLKFQLSSPHSLGQQLKVLVLLIRKKVKARKRMVVKLGWVKFIQRFALTDCVSERVQSRLATEPDWHWAINGKNKPKRAK